MFIRGGYNVYPAEVESVLADHPQVAAVAVVPAARRGDGRDRAWPWSCPPTRPTRPTLDDLRAFLEPKLARYKLPEALRVVDELPLTPMQKIDRRGLAAQESRTDP